MGTVDSAYWIVQDELAAEAGMPPNGRMIYGKALKQAIDESGLTLRDFASKCVKESGRALSRSAIDNYIRVDGIVAEEESARAVERALGKCCRTCGQYTEKPDAWNYSKAKTEGAHRGA